MYEKSVTYQFIGNVAGQRAQEGNSVEALTAGQMAIVNQTNVVATAGNNATYPANSVVRIAQRLANGQLVFSPEFRIRAGALRNYSTTAAAAATEHVAMFGHNGTNATGLGTITAGETYIINLVLSYTQGGVNNTPFIKTIPYRALAGDTELEVARGLVEAGIAIVNRNLPNRMIRVGRDFNPAQAFVAGVDDATVTYGSPAVAMNLHALDVGDVVHFDADAYIVTEVVDANNFIIDVPYQGASGTVGLADIGSTLAVNVPDGDWAVGFVALAQDFDPINSYYHNVMFDLTYSGFDDGIDIGYQAANPGTGTYEQVAMQEVYSAMNEGNVYISGYPRTNYRLEADPTAAYQILTFEFVHDAFEAIGTGQKPVSLVKLILAVESTLADDIADLNTILTA